MADASSDDITTQLRIDFEDTIDETIMNAVLDSLDTVPSPYFVREYDRIQRGISSILKRVKSLSDEGSEFQWVQEYIKRLPVEYRKYGYLDIATETLGELVQSYQYYRSAGENRESEKCHAAIICFANYLLLCSLVPNLSESEKDAYRGHSDFLKKVASTLM